MAILAHWIRNPLRLGGESAWPTLAAVGGIAAVVTIIFRWTCRDWVRAGIATAMVAFYVFYIPVFIAGLRLGFLVAATLHLVCILCLICLFRALPKSPNPLMALAGRINLVCMSLLVGTCLPLLVQQLQLVGARKAARTSLGELDGTATASSPDVWHIILDRYAAADTLKTRYGFDNRPFIDALRQRGFTIREPAFSNYQRTGHSVASTMNGVLLDPLSKPMANSPADWVPIYRAMRDGAAIRLFNRMGYRTVFAGSWWEPTRFSTIADESLQIRALPQLARVALTQSAIGFWLQDTPLPWFDGRADQCFRANEKFRQLRKLARSPSRKHVFAHFLVPHPPFVLNADGSYRSLEAARRASRTENYVAQVRWVNREAVALIDAILAGPRPAVIVIHSDEGPWPVPYVGNEHGLGTDPVPVPWTQLTSEQLHEKMAILLAVRDPTGKPPLTMPQSPVQIYPALLRDHFGTLRQLPPSRNYVFVGDNALYQFEDVTDRLTGK